MFSCWFLPLHCGRNRSLPYTMCCKHCDKPSFLNALRIALHILFTHVPQSSSAYSRFCGLGTVLRRTPGSDKWVFCPVSRPPLLYVLDLMHAISLGLVWLVPFLTSCVGSQNKVAYYESWISSSKDCDKRVNYQRLCMEIRQEWTPAETWPGEIQIETTFSIC